MKKVTIILFVLGIFILIFGIMYGPGIPYQNPPPELYEQFKKDDHIADMILNSGLVFIFVSFILFIITLFRKLIKKSNNL